MTEIQRIDFKERLVKEYAGLVQIVAKKIAARLPANIELDDLISAGNIGLLDALDKYDSTKKNTFKTYAEWRVRGSILDEIRSQDWLPRSVRDKAKLFEKAINQLRHATDQEAAAALKISLDEYYELVDQIKPITVMSIDDEENPIELQDKRDEIRAWEAQEDLRRVSIGLPQRQKIMTKLYYVWGLKCIEIAELFDCTESRVSQIITQGEFNLKKKVGTGGSSPATAPPPPSFELPDHDFEEGA